LKLKKEIQMKKLAMVVVAASLMFNVGCGTVATVVGSGITAVALYQNKDAVIEKTGKYAVALTELLFPTPYNEYRAIWGDGKYVPINQGDEYGKRNVIRVPSSDGVGDQHTVNQNTAGTQSPEVAGGTGDQVQVPQLGADSGATQTPLEGHGTEHNS
jgi:hypothetical protein